MTTIEDLPGELLDEIFAYLHPEIPIPKGRLVNLVCRRWNRPFMTTHLRTKVPKHVNLQLQCPRLVSMDVRIEKLRNFKGHAFLKELATTCYKMSKLKAVPSYYGFSNCPRLTRLRLGTDLCFDNARFDAFMTLCQSLTHLDLFIEIGKNIKGKMTRILNARDRDYQGLLKLKNLKIATYDYEGNRDEDGRYYKLDSTLFCSLFQAPFLENLEIHHSFDSGKQQSKVLSLFPNVRSIHLRDYYMDAARDIYEHVTDLLFIQGNVNLLLILKQFPKVVSLDTRFCKIIFQDVEHPTQIRKLIMFKVNPTNHMWMFPRLQELDCMVSSQNCNDFMRELGSNCPKLAHVTLQAKSPDKIDCDFGNILFPLLIKLKLEGEFVFNESLNRFVARHPNLGSFEYDSRGQYQKVQKESSPGPESIQWPNLACLTLKKIGHESVIPRLHWFLKTSPNLVHLTFDMGNYVKTGNESEIPLYSPNLQSLDYTGNVSEESLRKWIHTGNWSKSLKKLTLKVNFDHDNIILFLQFLGSLDRTQDINLTLCQYFWYDGEDPKDVNVVYNDVSVMRNGNQS